MYKLEINKCIQCYKTKLPEWLLHFQASWKDKQKTVKEVDKWQLQELVLSYEFLFPAFQFYFFPLFFFCS